MASNQEDVVLLLRTLYGGILAMTAGQTYQLFLCANALQQAQKMPRRLKKSRRPYIITMLAILVLSGLIFVIDALDKGAIFTPGKEITSETVLPPDPLWWHIASPIAIGGIHFAGDGLLAWRTYVLWSNNAFVRYLPIIPYIGSFGTLIAYIAITSKWALNPVDSGLLLVVRIQTAYFLTSISVSLLATTLICWRLLFFKRKVERMFDGTQIKAETPYLRISTILVESALPFTMFGLACAIITALFENPDIYAATHAAYHILWPMWVVSCALAPQLIIARILNGSSWTHDPTQQLDDMVSSLEFSAAPNPSRGNANLTRQTSTLQLSRSQDSSTLSPSWR